MASQDKPRVSQPTPTIPLPYILWCHYIEPLSSAGGVIAALYSPHYFLQVFTPTGSTIILDRTQPLPPLEQMLLTQTLSLYALFVVLEGVFLNWVFKTSKLQGLPEVRMQIFTLIMWVCLASDVFYTLSLWGMWKGQGFEEVFWRPWLWGSNEWTTIGATWVPFVQRVCFLMGVGVGKGGKQRSE